MSYSNEKQQVMVQPGMQPGMSMNPALDAGMQRDADGTREWKHGLCGCTDGCGTCKPARPPPLHAG
jgi:hypothetical protein